MIHNVDITNYTILSDTIKDLNPEFVFHLAAKALVRKSYLEPLETLSTNALGTAHILEALRDLSHPVIAVLITSDKVYDNVEWVWGYRETEDTL